MATEIIEVEQYPDDQLDTVHKKVSRVLSGFHVVLDDGKGIPVEEFRNGIKDGKYFPPQNVRDLVDALASLVVNS